jgi:pilus assembly protein CpaE
MTDRPGSPPPSAPLPAAMVFVADRESEGIIRQCLSDIDIMNVEFNNSNINAAILELTKRTSPRLLVVDVSGINDPTAQVNRLAEVCEPGTGVIVIGETNDITLYREFKEAGVVEYFFKPLVRDLFVRSCNGILTGNIEFPGSRMGKLVFVLGISGGVGATTIAVNTAWSLAETYQRLVMFVDLDVHSGDAALQLNTAPNEALREALEHPERVDDLFIQRGVTHVTKRLNLLASLEPFDNIVAPEEKAVLSLLATLLHRYRYVFVDMPISLVPQLMKVLYLPSICLLVSNSSLTAVRDIVRWREKIGPNTLDRSTLHILNNSDASNSLPESEFMRAIGHPPDIIIPQDHEIGAASRLGIAEVRKVAALQRGLEPVLRLLAGKKGKPRDSFLGRVFG